MTPTPDVRIDWRGDGLNTIANDAFLVDTSGWSISAGINAAATSLTRATADGVLGGVATNTCAELVTTATNGSGTTYDFGTTSFVSGRAYRFVVWLKRVSGTTAGRILIGSLGTPGDRASSTFTLNTAWVRYTIDWTPSGTRTDVEAIVTNNAASVLTVRVCLAEVFEAIDDIGAYGSDEVTGLSVGHGANFDGTSDSPGRCSLGVADTTKKYAPDNASGALFGLLTTDRTVWVRAVYQDTVYGMFAGSVRRIVPHPRELAAEITAEDQLNDFDRAEVSVALSQTRSIRDFRGAILDAMSEPAVRRNLATGTENDIPLTFADQRSALGLLTELNQATGSVHYIRAHPSASVRYVYTTIDRVALTAGTSAEHFDDTAIPSYITGLASYDVTDEARVTSQRVTPTPRAIATTSDTVWASEAVPFSIAAGLSRTVWASFDDPVVAQAVAYTATNAPTVNLTAFGKSAKIVITAGGSATDVSALSVTGRAVRATTLESALATTGTATRKGSDISSEWLASTATAQGLADSIIYRYGTDKARPDLVFQNRQDSHLLREVAETVTVTLGKLALSAKVFLVRTVDTTVAVQALVWVTQLGLEVAPASDTWFQLDTAGRGLDDAAGGPEGKLAY